MGFVGNLIFDVGSGEDFSRLNFVVRAFNLPRLVLFYKRRCLGVYQSADYRNYKKTASLCSYFYPFGGLNFRSGLRLESSRRRLWAVCCHYFVNMSAGSPTGGGVTRQRYSQGYSSGSDDLEDDARSRLSPQPPSSEKRPTWVEIVKNILWIASAVFIIYYGDRHFNFIYLLWHDNRIHRIPLYLGMAGVSFNVIFFLSSLLARSLQKSSGRWDFSSASNLPVVTVVGIISFCLFSFALWPIWSFLTLPLVFTLFMAGMIVVPYSMLGTLKPQTDVLRID